MLKSSIFMDTHLPVPLNYILGKEGPKQMRRVTVRKLSSLKSDTIVPSLPIKQDLKNRNRIKRSYNANSYHIPFKNMSFIMKKS